jgi:hypothetical protein
MSRKELFLVAVQRSSLRTAAEFARSIGVSRTHLYRTLDNPRLSAPVTEKIDAFIAEHVGQIPAPVAIPA